MNIRKIAIPPETLIQKSFAKTDYEDAFLAEFSAGREISVEEVLKAFFLSAPAWVKKLFNLRNSLVRLIGLKTPDTRDEEKLLKNFKGNIGETVGLFKILGKTQDEILLGEDDKHLNFRISFLLKESQPKNYHLTLSTTVVFNNLLGKLYFLPVKPFHSLIVPSMMKSIVKYLQKENYKIE